MPVFLDFEASSLGKKSYPIEVAWVQADGSGETHLIRPEPEWTDWDESAASIHGISRGHLIAEGAPAGAVARRMAHVLAGEALFASAPSWDGKWLSVLLRAGGLPRHLLRLRDSVEAFAAAVVSSGGDADPEAVARRVSEARAQLAAGPPAHRALEDAREEWAVWALLSGRARGQASAHPSPR